MKLFTSSYSKGNLIANPVKDNIMMIIIILIMIIIIRIINGILHGQMKNKIDKESVRRVRKVPMINTQIVSIIYIGTIKKMDWRKQEFHGLNCGRRNLLAMN